jgi:quinol monooxygenase YgiN
LSLDHTSLAEGQVVVSNAAELALGPPSEPRDSDPMTGATEVVIFARFHARPGQEAAVADALLGVIAPTRQEPGCLSVHAFRSIRDPQLFYIHSRWTDEAAFELHAVLPHTVRFLECVETLIDHALDVARTRQVG